MVYAAHLKGEKSPWDVNLTKPAAFLLGNEARGLSEETACLADQYIKIPIPGKAESYNLSIAAGILMYETMRQRMLLK